MLSTRQGPEAPRAPEDAEVEALPAVRPSAARERPPREREDPTLAELAWALFERRWTVIAVAGAALALAASYLFLSPPLYESSLLVLVESRARPIAAFEHLDALFDGETPVEGEMRIMRSRALLGPVVDQLGLDIEARPRTLPFVGDALARRYAGSGPAPARLGLPRFAWGGERIRVGRLAVSDGLMGQPLLLTALEGGRYRVSARDGALLLEGEVGVPAAARGAGVDQRVELLLSELSARPGTEFILRKLRRIDAIEQLQDALRITEQGTHTGLVEVALEGRDPARIAAVLDALSTRFLRHSVERTSAEAARTLRILEAQLPVLKSNLEKAERSLNRFRRRNGTVNLPVEVEAMLARIGEIDRVIAENDVRGAELSHRYTEQHSEISDLAERMERLQVQRTELERRMRALPDLELESTRLSRQVRVATELYMLVLNRAEELRIVKSGWIGNVRIVESAFVPQRPVSPKHGVVLALAAILGLAAGTGTAFARRALDRGARDPDEIEAGIGLPVLATIPRSVVQRRLARRAGRARLPALSRVEPTDAAVEDLRGLLASLEFVLLRARNNVVVVGGLVPRAGKTFVSVNLAHLLAAAGGRILLVDGDLRRGTLHRHFGMEPSPGLAEVVGGVAQLDAGVHPTEVTGLDLLPAGLPPTNPGELLSGAAFQQLLAECSRRYKVVIVDTPPFLSVADGSLVGRHAGVNLLVLRAGEHSTGEISFALRRLAQNGVTFRGAILNEVRRSRRYYARSIPYSGLGLGVAGQG